MNDNCEMKETTISAIVDKILPDKCRGSFSFIMTAQWDYVRTKIAQKYLDDPYSISMDERVNMERATRLLLESGKWEPYDAVQDIADHYEKDESFPFTKSGYETRRPLYKEYLYFNNNLRHVIYNQVPYHGENACGKSAYENAKEYARQIEARKQPVVVLKRKLEQEYNYYYLVRAKSEKQVNDNSNTFRFTAYRLPICAIELRLYRMGVLVFAIRCHDEDNVADFSKEFKYKKVTITKKSSLDKATCSEIKQWIDDLTKLNEQEWVAAEEQDDISWIEDAGRRMFLPRPVFPVDGCITDYPNEAPYFSAVQSGNEWYPICDYRSLLGEKAVFPEHLSWTEELIAPNCMSSKAFSRKMRNKEDVYRESATTSKSEGRKAQGTLVVDCFNDDRMYLHGTIVSDRLAANISKAYRKRREDGCDWENLRRWYGILSADNNWEYATYQDEVSLLELLEAETDPRWIESKTLYGMTYHSMVQLIVSNSPMYLMENMDWIYFQMFLIAVLQRCSVQRFYREASGLLQTYGRNEKKRRQALKDRYLVFLNQIWFNDVTEQEQGQFFFQRMQKNMKVAEDVAFLDEALEELNEQEQKRLESTVNDYLTPMSVIGGVWAILEMSVSAMNVFGLERQNNGLEQMAAQGGPGSLTTFLYALGLLVTICMVVRLASKRIGSLGNLIKKGCRRIGKFFVNLGCWLINRD